MLVQKLMGVGAVIAGLISIPALENDATVALLFVPLGLFLILAKKDYTW